MKKLLLLAVGCLLFAGIAAHADPVYNFTGVLSASSGNVTVNGTFTWNGSNVTSWNLDFGNLAGTCGYTCQLGALPAFSTIGDGYLLVGNASDTNDTQTGDDSYMSYDGGLTNTILAIAGEQNDSANYGAQLYFDFNAIPGSFNTLSGNNVYAEFTNGGLQNDYQWVSGSAVLATPEPPSAVLMLTGGLLLMAGLTWYERRRKLTANN